jgi:hypothetical protein
MHQEETATRLLEQAAEAAKAAEDAFRKSAAAETARLQGIRVIAFRRVRLVDLLERSMPPGDDVEARVEYQADRLCREFGWSRESAAHAEVIARLQPVFRALATGATSTQGGEVVKSLEAFENWFSSARGISFYALFDTHVQETPVVDF